MSCKYAKFDSEEGRYDCELTGKCIYMLADMKRCLSEGYLDGELLEEQKVRVIKFRVNAKVKEGNTFYSSEDKCFIESGLHEVVSINFGSHIVINKGSSVLVLFYRDCEITLQQYTGLKDKNGVEICEGDIGNTTYANCIRNKHIEKVVFIDGCFKTTVDDKGYSTICTSATHFNFDKTVYMIDFEVIGNLHEHPKLLEQL